MAALEDTLDRVKQQLSDEAQSDNPVDLPSGHGKRQHSQDEDEEPHPKRVKTDTSLQGGQVMLPDSSQEKGKGKCQGTGKEDEIKTNEMQVRILNKVSEIR